MIVTAKELLRRADEKNQAVGAFNTSTLEVTKAILAAAHEAKTPVIIETSEGESLYLGTATFVASVKEIAKEMSVDVAINYDHGRSFESLKQAIENGYTAVHFDGSKIEREENIKIAREVVAFAHNRGVSVEGEFNDIGGSSEMHKSGFEPAALTDPVEALDFIQRTGIDIFAGSYGNIHGVYENPPVLNIDLIKEINGKTDAYLSLHGGSGIDEAQIKAAIAAGIRKINVNTELRIAYMNAMKNDVGGGGEPVPYKILPAVIEEVKAVVAKKIALFSS